MKTSVKMGGNVKKIGQMNTIVYVRLDSPERTVNVIKTALVKKIKTITFKFVFNKNKN